MSIFPETYRNKIHNGPQLVPWPDPTIPFTQDVCSTCCMFSSKHLSKDCLRVIGATLLLWGASWKCLGDYISVELQTVCLFGEKIQTLVPLPWDMTNWLAIYVPQAEPGISPDTAPFLGSRPSPFWTPLTFSPGGAALINHLHLNPWLGFSFWMTWPNTWIHFGHFSWSQEH